MPSKFASGKYAIAQCDRCGFRTKLAALRALVIKTKVTNIRVCKECWEPDHPQLQIGMYPVNDPQAVRNPRPDSPGYPESRAFVDQIYAGAGVGVSIGTVTVAVMSDLVTEDEALLVTEDGASIVDELPPP